MSAGDTGVAQEATDDRGIDSGDVSVHLEVDGNAAKTSSTKDFWQDTTDYWIFWKVKPSKGVPTPFAKNKGPVVDISAGTTLGEHD